MNRVPFGLDGWQYREAPADPNAVAALSAAAPIELPDEYLSLLRVSNGGGGPLEVEPGWFHLWSAQEVVAANREYEVQERVPGLFGFGSNGGGELLAFDARQGPPWKIVMVPFIGMDESAIMQVAEDFSEFLRATGREMHDA